MTNIFHANAKRDNSLLRREDQWMTIDDVKLDINVPNEHRRLACIMWPDQKLIFIKKIIYTRTKNVLLKEI